MKRQSILLKFMIVAFCLLVVLLQQGIFKGVAWFNVDDFSNFGRASNYSTWQVLVRSTIFHPSRPISYLLSTLYFRSFAFNFSAYRTLGMTGWFITLLIVFVMGYELTGRRSYSLLAITVFAFLPNQSTNLFNVTMITSNAALALPVYAGMMLFGVRYVKGGRMADLFASVVLYFVGAFSYEIGLFLPLALVVLIEPRRWLRFCSGSMLPYGVVICFYGLWRKTGAFGMGESGLIPPHMEAGSGLSLLGVYWNAREFANRWIGMRMVRSFSNGWLQFGEMGGKLQVGMAVLALVFVIGWLCVGLWQLRQEHTERDRIAGYFTRNQVLLFSCSWVFLAIVPLLFSYTADRLNSLPAIGIVLLVTYLLLQVNWRFWVVPVSAFVFLGMISVWGTAQSWGISGEFNRRLHKHLQETRDVWQDKEVIHFDTGGRREWYSKSIFNQQAPPDRKWFEYGNAGLLRGFVLNAMVKVIAGTTTVPVCVLDYEYGARRKGDLLFWHERYDPSRTRQTDMKDVYHVDLWGMK